MRKHPLVCARRGELLLCGLGVVALEDAGLRLHDLAERPYAPALAVRERAALPPPVDVGIRVERREELGDEAALADPGDADERHQLRGLLTAGARKRVGEQEQLALSTDER